MKLGSYRTGEARAARAAVLVGSTIVDAAAAADAAGCGGLLDWTSVRAILEGGDVARDALELAVASAAEAEIGLVDGDVQLAPPIPDPRKILCLGLNYRDHAEEAGLEAPAAPILMAKFATSLVGSGEPVIVPPIAGEVDCEAELAVVVGRRCRHVPRSQVRSILFGATAFNDVTARDVQLQTSQWMAGKAIDHFAPCGPWIVSLDELGELENLSIRGRVNGNLLQDGNTRDMIFSVAEAVAFISELMTLEPGDIVATGTPAGVGFARTPPVLLGPSDTIEVEIDGIGVLRNPIEGMGGDGRASGAVADVSRA